MKPNVGILKHKITKTTSIKKLKLNLKDSPKSRNYFPKEKINNRKIKFNTTIKVPEIEPKERENNKLKTHMNKSNLKIYYYYELNLLLIIQTFISTIFQFKNYFKN